MFSKTILRTLYHIVLFSIVANTACSFTPSIPAEKSSGSISPTTTEIRIYDPASTPTSELAQPIQYPESTEPAPPTRTVEQAPTATLLPGLFPTESQDSIHALAFLKDGDIWILDKPGSELYPLTFAGDILSFTWSPNGERLAAYNGRTLCFFHRDGSVRTACLDLGLDEKQAAVERRLVMSADQRWIVLWNPFTPPEQGLIGWMIIALDTTNIMYRIEDPSDWGASLDLENPQGGFTGQPVFLPDGRLVGALSHRSLCDADICQYHLFQFDFTNRVFIPFSDAFEDSFTQGMSISLSEDGSKLISFSRAVSDCPTYSTYINVFDVNTQKMNNWELMGEFLTDISFNSNLSQAIIARSSGCKKSDDSTWSASCGLSTGYETLSMQIWTPEINEVMDLIEGVEPTWSPDDSWVVFSSCLAKGSSERWEPNPDMRPVLYLLEPQTGIVLELIAGSMPQWQP